MTVTELKFERTVTLGNLMSMLTMIVAAVSAYFMVVNRLDVMTERDQAFLSRLVVVEAGNQTLRESFIQERLNTTQLLTQMKSDVQYLRISMDDVKQTLSN